MPMKDLSAAILELMMFMAFTSAVAEPEVTSPAVVFWCAVAVPDAAERVRSLVMVA